MALGIFISTLGSRSFTKFNSLLIGDILSVEPGKIGLLALILLLVLALWGLSFNHLMLSAVHPALGDSRRVRVFWQEALFSAAIAVVVTVSMTWVGLLVINSLLVLPAAAARNISRNMFQYHLCSLLFAVGAGIAGLMTSYYIGSSAGASQHPVSGRHLSGHLPAAKAGMNSQEKSAVRHLFRCRAALLRSSMAIQRSLDPRRSSHSCSSFQAAQPQNRPTSAPAITSLG